MKKYIIAAMFSVAATAASAGLKYGQKTETNSDGDLTGAVILLGLVAVVIASNTLFGGSNTVMKPTIAEDDALENDS